MTALIPGLISIVGTLLGIVLGYSIGTRGMTDLAGSFRRDIANGACPICVDGRPDDDAGVELVRLGEQVQLPIGEAGVWKARAEAAEARVAELEEMASVRHFRTMKKRAEAAERSEPPETFPDRLKRHMEEDAEILDRLARGEDADE